MPIDSATPLQFKYSENSSPEVRTAVLLLLDELGATQLEPLFPGETDPELADLFLASFPSNRVDDALQALANHPAIEFAESQSPRTLIW